MRVLSLAGVQALLAEQTDHAWVFAVRLSRGTDDPGAYWEEHYVSNTVGFDFQGIKYLPLPMEVTLAADNEDAPPQARLRIDNVWRGASEAVRKTHYPPNVRLMLFRITPDGTPNLEMTSDFTLLSATVNNLTVEGILGYRNDFLNEPALHTRFTPMLCPGLFKSTESTGLV